MTTDCSFSALIHLSVDVVIPLNCKYKVISGIEDVLIFLFQISLENEDDSGLSKVHKERQRQYAE